MARSKKPATSTQLNMFDRPAAPKKRQARKEKTAAGRRSKKAPKRKRQLSQGEVRHYTSQSGHRYELRRLT